MVMIEVEVEVDEADEVGEFDVDDMVDVVDVVDYRLRLRSIQVS